LEPKNSNRPLLIAIAGTLPPPIGGVTIHVKRLIEHLKQNNIKHEFYGPKISDLLNLLLKKRPFDIVHIHHSNAIARWMIVKILHLKNAKTLITIHRDLGREIGIKKYFTDSAIKLATIPIVLNYESFKTAKRINNNTRKISAFLPPQPEIALTDIKQYESINPDDLIFCTNAYDLVYDNLNHEIYQITELVNIFSKLDKRFQLMISDPTGNNYNHIKSKIQIPANIRFIAKPHNFIDIILQSHCLIRATTTDGDSISVKEALYYGVNVIASDCVDRPDSCTLFKTRDTYDLSQKISQFKKTSITKPENAFPNILNAYHSISQLS